MKNSLLAVLLLCAPLAWAQARLEDGGHELQLWTGGGHSVSGGTSLNLKWNFATRGRIVPYFELSGGTLFTTHEVPARTSTLNFTPGAALGTHFLGDKHSWSLEVRYLHISNAGLASLNPGINTVQVRLGVGKFLGQR